MALKQQWRLKRKGLCTDCGTRPLHGKWQCRECMGKRAAARRIAPQEEHDNRKRPRVDGNYIYAW